MMDDPNIALPPSSYGGSIKGVRLGDGQLPASPPTGYGESIIGGGDADVLIGVLSVLVVCRGNFGSPTGLGPWLWGCLDQGFRLLRRFCIKHVRWGRAELWRAWSACCRHCCARARLQLLCYVEATPWPPQISPSSMRSLWDGWSQSIPQPTPEVQRLFFRALSPSGLRKSPGTMPPMDNEDYVLFPSGWSLPQHHTTE